MFIFPGKYKVDRLTEAVLDISKTLGPIFKLNLSGKDMVITIDADDAKTLYLNEGKYPVRPPFPALEHYRKKRFNSIGVVPGNGEEWYKFRSGVTPLLKNNLVQSYAKEHEAVADTFVEYIRVKRNNNYILEDLFLHLLKFAIEGIFKQCFLSFSILWIVLAISVTCPGYRIPCLLDNEIKSETIIQASIDLMNGLYSTLVGLPVWKLYKTDGYRKLETSHELIYR